MSMMSTTSSAGTIAARQQRSNTSNDECHLTASPPKPRQRSSRKRPVRVSAQGLGIWTKINIPTSQFSICMSVHKFRNIGCPTLDSFLDSDSGTKVSYRWLPAATTHMGCQTASPSWQSRCRLRTDNPVVSGHHAMRKCFCSETGNERLSADLTSPLGQPPQVVAPVSEWREEMWQQAAITSLTRQGKGTTCHPE